MAQLFPTAKQAFVDAQETASKLLSSPEYGSVVVWIDQRLPFQRSASGARCLSGVAVQPTAVQALGDTHDTPSSPPGTLGVGWIDQRLPFQRSTNAASPAGTVSWPTATHADGEAQDTAVKP
jgi:hypothetical protein